MAASKQQSQTALKKWRHHVEAQQSSGLSANAYCKENDLEPRYFSLWRKRISSKKMPENQFVSLNLKNKVDDISIETPKGYKIKIQSVFDASALNNLLDLLERR